MTRASSGPWAPSPRDAGREWATARAASCSEGTSLGARWLVPGGPDSLEVTGLLR